MPDMLRQQSREKRQDSKGYGGIVGEKACHAMGYGKELGELAGVAGQG